MSAFISVLNIHVHMNIVLVLYKENILLFCYYYYYYINYLLDACILCFDIQCLLPRTVYV